MANNDGFIPINNEPLIIDGVDVNELFRSKYGRKSGRKKGAKFTVDSKGNVVKNHIHGGAVMSGRGNKFKGVF